MSQMDKEPQHPFAKPSEIIDHLSQALAPKKNDVGLTALQSRQLMQQRADKLALPVARASAEGQEIEIVTFALGTERYAIAAKYVQEILPCKRITRVPSTPDFVLGVVNIHGQLVALFDIARLFGLKDRERRKSCRIVVLGESATQLAIMADQVESVCFLDSGKLQEPPEFTSGAGRNHLSGVTDDALILLDGALLLADPRLLIE